MQYLSSYKYGTVFSCDQSIWSVNYVMKNMFLNYVLADLSDHFSLVMCVHCSGHPGN